MKRLLLLLAALFVVATIQAQVVCYEYEYSYTKYWIGREKEPRKEVSPNYRGHKIYWAIDKNREKEPFTRHRQMECIVWRIR